MDKITFFVAGVQYHEIKTCEKSLEVGDILTLTLEPSNKYDPNAVRIEFLPMADEETIMLGYVPRRFSSKVSAAIIVGKPVQCKIVELNLTAKPWEKLKVCISEVEVDEDEQAA